MIPLTILSLHVYVMSAVLSFSISSHRSVLPRHVEKSRHALRLFGVKQTKSREGMGKPKGYYDLKSRYVLQNECLSGLPNISKPFIVLGIESSCDDTGVSILRSTGEILSHVVLSQHNIHEKFGGVVPSLAMEAHRSNIDTALTNALAQAGLTSVAEVDAIAVTKGPGLEICLRVGYRKAQALAREHQKPFVAVHHLEAHCMVARLAGQVISESNDSTPKPTFSTSADCTPQATASPGSFTPKVRFPFLTLLASGGHTSILLCRGLGNFTVLGGTLDDALGEAFDKAARLLGLKASSSGGAAVERAATLAKGGPQMGNMKIPMRDKPNCDFSYAGLKNTFRMAVQEARAKCGLDPEGTNAPANQMEEAPEAVALPDEVAAELCAQFQDVAFAHVEDKLGRALDGIDRMGVNVTALVVVGGVAANMELRKRLLNLLAARARERPPSGRFKHRQPPGTDQSDGASHSEGVATDGRAVEGNDGEVPASAALPQPQPLSLVFPPPSLCTDNGVMVAWAGVEKLLLGISDDVEDEAVRARWPLGTPVEDSSIFKKNYVAPS